MLVRRELYVDGEGINDWVGDLFCTIMLNVIGVIGMFMNACIC